MPQERIIVEATASAPVDVVRDAYTMPDRITQWNFASDDWHCPTATVDLREGGTFTARMAAKDGSMGFDVAGTDTRIVPNERIEYAFGDRHAVVEFTALGDRTGVTVAFDPETDVPIAQQRSGWAAILGNLCRHVARGRAAPDASAGRVAAGAVPRSPLPRYARPRRPRCGGGRMAGSSGDEGRACGQLPAPRSSTVTARRFCDQHEMSLQTATGRSLP
ncbi:hypothetical protein FV232_21730 [Methylobacterium sp. WL30]|nr:hypothetical protein FV225_16600 [Methylobacterium sp. WL93]TXN46192.1 hypothetical protein FV227_23865 [Methylobacterium sp. WL119]TXN64065.1 hypothetical protein FV232_21730 [Methylobacterium sp. WL30]